MLQQIKTDLKPRSLFGRILKTIGVIALQMVINNQKGVKGTDNVGRVDEIFDEIKKS